MHFRCLSVLVLGALSAFSGPVHHRRNRYFSIYFQRLTPLLPSNLSAHLCGIHGNLSDRPRRSARADGKTFLLDHAWPKSQRVFYFLAAERVERGDGPSYGRPNWVARLQPFDYRGAARMMPRKSPRDAATFFGVFGGTPRYLATVEARDTIAGRTTPAFEALARQDSRIHLISLNDV